MERVHRSLRSGRPRDVCGFVLAPNDLVDLDEIPASGPFLPPENAPPWWVILGGIPVFGEPVGSGAFGISACLLAFGLVIAGAALVPAPGASPGAGRR